MTVNRSLFHFSISLLTVCPFSISIFLYLNPFFCHCLPLQFFIFTFSLIFFFLLPSSILLCLSPFLFLSSFFPLFISPLYISVAYFFLILPYSLYLPLNRCLCVHPFLFSPYLSSFYLFPPFFPLTFTPSSSYPPPNSSPSCLLLSFSLSLLQMAHLVPVKTHSSSMSGSQSLQDQTGSALSEGISAGSPRPEMPRQNSDPTSDTPGPPLRVTGREERDRERDRDRDRDRTAWLREEDIPPKVRELQSERKINNH